MKYALVCPDLSFLLVVRSLVLSDEKLRWHEASGSIRRQADLIVLQKFSLSVIKSIISGLFSLKAE